LPPSLQGLDQRLSQTVEISGDYAELREILLEAGRQS
jgi:hypothetical protein